MIGIARTLLIIFTFLLNLLLALFLLGIGLFGMWTGEEVRFDLVPGVVGEPLVTTLLAAGAFGLAALLMALSRAKAARLAMLIWNILAFSLLVCAFTRPSYRFRGMEHFWTLAGFTLLSIVALWGSWIHLRRGGATG